MTRISIGRSDLPGSREDTRVSSIGKSRSARDFKARIEASDLEVSVRGKPKQREVHYRKLANN